jgi:beta-galactosidase
MEITKNFLCTILVLCIQLQLVGQEFSTAGFYQTDPNVRQAINFNVGWRFIKGDVKGAE